MSVDLEMKMNQVDEQKADCLLLIPFTKYFCLAAFQVYSSSVFPRSLLLSAAK